MTFYDFIKHCLEKEQLITLVEKGKSGDAAAMEALLQIAHTSVSYQCRKILRSAQDAEDPAHAHSYDSTVTEPTCTSGGYTTYTCACGYSYVGGQTAALGHDWILAVPNEPTCGMDGSNYYHCTVCPEDYSEKLPALGHNMTDWYVVHEATTEQAGMEMRRCQNKGCDNVLTRTIPKLSSEET